MKAIVLGSAPCLIDDMEQAYDLCEFDKIYAVNQTPLKLPYINVWVSAHPENMPQWQALYKAYHKDYDINHIDIVCSTRNTRAFPARIDRVVQIRWDGMQTASAGSSALLAVKTALEDGATHIIVAGCPLDDSGNIGNNGGDPLGNYAKFRSGWDWAKDNKFNDRVRAMSGYPKEILKAPTKYWLDKKV